LAAVAGQLLHNFQTREADRLAAADERAAMAGKGPILDVLRRKLAEARADDLFNDATPIVSRFEAYQAVNNARGRYPQDRGLRMASAHLQQLWHRDAGGVLTLGDIARVREHYSRQFPRSVVAEVIDGEIPRIGFNTLPVHKLAPMAAQVVGSTDEERQYAYEQVVVANGLNTNSPNHRRAREFIRAMADMAAEPAPQQDPRTMTGADVANRTLTRMAAYDDPILSRIGQAMPPPGEPQPSMLDEGVPPIEEEIPHEEETEVIEEVPHPTEPDATLVVELGEAEPAPEAGESFPPTGGPDEVAPMSEEIQPGVVASLQYFGQLDDYAMTDPLLEEEQPIEPTDAPSEEVIMEDPVTGGEIKVTLEVLEPEGDNAVAPGPMPPGMENEAARRAGAPRVGYVYRVHAVSGGVVKKQPLERVRAAGMPAMLRRIARGLRAADGGGHSREVRAHQPDFNRIAFVVLDDMFGNYLMIRAEQGSEFNVDVPATGQPVVQHHVELSQSQGRDVLVEDKDLKQTPPPAESEEDHPTADKYEVKARALTATQVKKICAKMGLTAAKIEEALFAGREVVVGPARLAMRGDGDVEFYRGDRGRVASLMDLDEVIGHFMAFAASLKPSQRQAAVKKLGYRVQPLFTVGCGHCGYLGEYLMPDKPENVRCAGCGWITPQEAVAIQIEARGQTAFPGYVIRADIPGKEEHRKINAKRMLTEIKQVVHTNGALVRAGQLEVTVRNAGEAEVKRIRRVLEDKFGARDVMAVTAPAPTIGPMGTPMQHATNPMQPAQVPMQQQSPTYVGPPQQPQQPGMGMMQQPQAGAEGQAEFIEANTDPGSMPDVQPAQPRLAAASLPVGPGLKHVQIRYPDGKVTWTALEVASEQMARSMIASFMDGTEVLQVVDSQLRQAQGGEALGADIVPGEAPLGIEMENGEGGGGSGGNILTQADLDSVEHAFNWFRDERLGKMTAVDKFMTSEAAREILTRFGDEQNPNRHMAESAIFDYVQQLYEKPAIVGQPPMQMGTLAHRRRAEEPKGPTPKKINEQQDDWVNLGDGDDVLGPDSGVGEGFDDPSVNTQVDPMDQPGASGADTSQQPDTETRDPKRFDAPKPPADGEVFTPAGPGWGTSYSDKDLGEDSDTGDNPVTKEMGSESAGAYSNVRSK
jgi:hypothetical protein